MMTIILSYPCSLAVVAVPHRTQGQCLFSQEWEDIWVEPKQGAKVWTMDISTEYLQYQIYLYNVSTAGSGQLEPPDMPEKLKPPQPQLQSSKWGDFGSPGMAA